MAATRLLSVRSFLGAHETCMTVEMRMSLMYSSSDNEHAAHAFSMAVKLLG